MAGVKESESMSKKQKKTLNFSLINELIEDESEIEILECNVSQFIKKNNGGKPHQRHSTSHLSLYFPTGLIILFFMAFKMFEKAFYMVIFPTKSCQSSFFHISFFFSGINSF